MSHLNASNLFSVKGLVAVVTGGGSGLGRTMALTLATNGASKVYVVGRRADALNETATLGPRDIIVPVQGDISSQESLEGVYNTLAAQTTHVDLLIANSGAMGPEARPQPSTKPDGGGGKPSIAEIRDQLWAVPKAEFSDVLDVNVSGTYYTVVALLPLLDAANKRRSTSADPNVVPPPRPQVLVTSSIAGFNRFVPYSFAYSLSKAAATHLVKMLATVFGEYDIRVNGIAPGLYHSELSGPLFESRGIQGRGVAEGSFPREAIPATRAGAEEDIAGAILWLAGPAGAYVNGNIVVTDGGRLGVVPSSY
ncbi:KR domain-containing protein [Aspergillus sp. HF37]|nr:KR domain-containing protein [Aspergillus sp. HF37]